MEKFDILFDAIQEEKPAENKTVYGGKVSKEEEEKAFADLYEETRRNIK